MSLFLKVGHSQKRVIIIFIFVQMNLHFPKAMRNRVDVTRQIFRHNLILSYRSTDYNRHFNEPRDVIATRISQTAASAKL